MESTAHIEEHPNYSATKVKYIKDKKYHGMPPVVAVKDLNRYQIIDGVNRHMSAKLNKKMLPSISISKELHTHLAASGYSNKDIVEYAISHTVTEKVPYQTAPPKRVSGLSYRNNIIDHEEIVKSYNILSKMKEIYNSEELKKAFIELGFYK